MVRTTQEKIALIDDSETSDLSLHLFFLLLLLLAKTYMVSNLGDVESSNLTTQRC